MAFMARQLDEENEAEQITPFFETFEEVRQELMSYRLRDYSGITIVEVVWIVTPYERIVARGNSIIGDWVGCEPSMAMAEERIDWRGQWLGRRIHRERLEHLARVARLANTGDPSERNRRLVDVYSAGVEYGVPSVWVVMLGDYDTHEEPDDVDEAWHAGPFSSDEEAYAALEGDGTEDDYSVVPRLPYSV